MFVNVAGIVYAVEKIPKRRIRTFEELIIENERLEDENDRLKDLVAEIIKSLENRL